MSFSISVPSAGVASLNGLQGALSLVAGSGITITPSGNNLTIAADGSELTIGALDAQAANANGLALVSGVLSAQSADATHPGMVNTASQSFAGAKTFTGTVTAAAAVANQDIQLGTLDAFSRPQIWNRLVNAVLRLGSLGSDGDVTTSSSEGIVTYGQNAAGDPMTTADFGYGRIKPMRVGLYNSSTAAAFAGYIFKVDPTALTLATDAGVTTFTVTRASGNLVSSGTLAGSNLSGTNTGDVTLAAVGAVPNANGASLSGQVLNLQPFDATHPGVVTASGGGTANFLRADGTWAAGGIPIYATPAALPAGTNGQLAVVLAGSDALPQLYYYTTTDNTWKPILEIYPGTLALLDETAKNAVTFTSSARGLWDEAGKQAMSFNAGSRSLFDAAATLSLDYNARKSSTAGGIVFLDWSDNSALGVPGLVDLSENIALTTVLSASSVDLYTDTNASVARKLNFWDGVEGGAISIQAPNSGLTPYALILPVAQGGANTVLTNDGAGNLSWSASGGANTALSNLAATAVNADIVPNGNYTKNLGSATDHWLNIYASTIQQNGVVPLAFQSEAAEIQLYNQIGIFSLYSDPGAPPQLRFWDDDASNWVALKSPSVVSVNTTFVLPSADGSANQVLKTDGSGNLSFVTQNIWASGATGSRPGSPTIGYTFLDTTLNKPIWYNGSNWIDATGATV